jgi:hypothetical protein
MNVTLSATDLKAKLVVARQFARRASGDAAWSFADGELTIEWAGVSSTIAGVGSGRGTIRVPSTRMPGLAKMDFAEGDLTVYVSDGRLYLGSFSFKIESGSDGPSAIPQLLPVYPTLRDVLLLPYRHDEGTIRAAGLTDTVAKALLSRAKHVLQASVALAPLGLSAQAVEDFVDTHLRAAARGQPAGQVADPGPSPGTDAAVGQVQRIGPPKTQ